MRIVKSKNLDKAANEVSYILLRRKPGDIQAAYKDLYAALRDTSPHGKLMKECGFTLEEMIEIIEKLRDYGYGLERYYYLPVYAFYHIRPLQFILAHRQELRRQSGQKTFAETALNLKQTGFPQYFI